MTIPKTAEQMKVVTRRHPLGVDRWRELHTPTARPEWTGRQWWMEKMVELPALNCVRVSDHGPAQPYHDASRFGQVLGYHCGLCGWDKVVLVQEGGLEPCEPARELKMSNHQRAALSKTPEALRRGAKVRAENVAKHGVKKRKAWWEDDDNE